MGFRTVPTYKKFFQLFEIKLIFLWDYCTDLVVVKMPENHLDSDRTASSDCHSHMNGHSFEK